MYVFDLILKKDQTSQTYIMNNPLKIWLKSLAGGFCSQANQDLSLKL